MGLVRFEDANIIVDISDKVVAGTTIKRKAEVQFLQYGPKEKRVVISLLILPFAAGEVDEVTGKTTYGESLMGVPGFSTYHRNIIADMTTLCDAATGVPFAGAQTLNDVTATGPGGILHDKNYMYEFEFYKMVAATQQVVIDDMISAVLMRADMDGRL